MTEPAGGPPLGSEPSERAAALKERIYVTFSLLGVLLALHPEADHLAAGTAALVVGVSALATVLAVTFADVLASTVVHRATPDRREVTHLAIVAAGALVVAVLPLLLIAAAALHRLSLSLALGLGAAALALTLVAIGALAVRRLDLTLPQRVLALVVEAVLAAVVIGLELLVH